MATINGTSVGGMTLQIDYSYTQNTTANTSTVTAKLQLVGHYALYATALSGSYLSIGGDRVDYNKTISYGGSSTTTTVLATKTVVVSHKNDGTGSCNLSGTFVMNGTYRGYPVGTMSVNSTITLPTIPRSSGLTVPASINTGSLLSGTVSPSLSTFNHKVEIKIGSVIKETIVLDVGGNAFSIQVPHSWFPNSTSGIISVVLSTYNGTTFIASTTKNVVANVPATAKPFVSALTATSSVISGAFANLHVQGKTTVTLTTTATTGGGSPIVSYTFSGPGINTTVSTNTVTTPILLASGTQTYTVTVKDARGRTASKTTSITVYPYAVPMIGPVSVQRCDANGNLTENGTYAKYTVNSTYSTVNNRNTRTVTVAHSSNNGSTYSTETTLQTVSDAANTQTGVYGGGAFTISNTYILRFTIKDAYGATSTITAPLQSAARPINISANGKGVSIGAMATKDGFEVSMVADFNKNVNIDGATTLKNNMYINGHIYMGGDKGATGENLIRFSNPDTSTNPHNVYIYGGNPSSAMAIGLFDAGYSRSVMTYADKANNLSFGNGNTNVYFNNTRMADFVVEQGTSGIWTYRKWNSGIAECWGSQRMLTATTSVWGALYASDKVSPVVNYPFTFTEVPQENVFCRGESIATIVYSEGSGLGMNTTTSTGSYKFLRATTMSDAWVRYEYTVIGRWK